MQERRKFRRTQAKERTSLESKEGKSHEGTLVDISPSGMRIVSESNIHLGSQPQGANEVGIKFSKVSTIPI